MAVALATRILRSNAVAALTTPHGVDRYLKHINPMWAAHEVRARIVDIHHEVDIEGEPRVATVTLQPTSTWAGHRAGQHVSVGVEVDGTRRTTRVFSVSSPDSKPGERFTITVRANPDRVPSVSSFLAYEAKPGQMIHLSQAEGDFVLPDRVPEHIVLISGGSGITPVMSMLRSLQRRTHRGQVTFLHYARSEDHQIFREELASIAGNGVDIHLLHPEAGDPNLSPAYLTKLLGEYAEIPTWACGPAPLMEAVKAAFADSDVLSTEYFQPPKSTGLAGGQVSYARSGTEAANSGETVLEQAEAAGLKPEFGCRMGICFSCTATKKSGLVRNVLTGETSELPDEDIRICVSAPEGDCVIDL